MSSEQDVTANSNGEFYNQLVIVMKEIFTSCDVEQTNSVPVEKLIDFIKPYMPTDLAPLDDLQTMLEAKSSDGRNINCESFFQIMNEWANKVEQEFNISDEVFNKTPSNLDYIADCDLPYIQSTPRASFGQKLIENCSGLFTNLSLNSSLIEPTIDGKALKDQIRDMELRICLMTTEIRDVKQQLLSAEEHNETLQSDLDRVNRRLKKEQEVNQQLQKNQKDCEELQCDLSLLQNKLNMSAKDVAQYEKKLAALQKTVETLQNEKEELQAKYDNLRRLDQENKNTIMDCLATIQEKENEITELNSTEELLQRTLTENREAITHLRNENELLQHTNQVLQGNLSLSYQSCSSSNSTFTNQAPFTPPPHLNHPKFNHSLLKHALINLQSNNSNSVSTPKLEHADSSMNVSDLSPISSAEEVAAQQPCMYIVHRSDPDIIPLDRNEKAEDELVAVRAEQGDTRRNTTDGATLQHELQLAGSLYGDSLASFEANEKLAEMELVAEKQVDEIAHWKSLAGRSNLENITLAQKIKSLGAERDQLLQDWRLVCQEKSQLETNLQDADRAITSNNVRITELGEVVLTAKETEKRLEEAESQNEVQVRQFAKLTELHGDLVETHDRFLNEFDAQKKMIGEQAATIAANAQSQQKMLSVKQAEQERFNSILRGLQEDNKALIEQIEAKYGAQLAELESDCANKCKQLEDDLNAANLNLERKLLEKSVELQQLHSEIAEIIEANLWLPLKPEQSKINALKTLIDGLKEAKSIGVYGSASSTSLDGGQPKKYGAGYEKQQIKLERLEEKLEKCKRESHIERTGLLKENSKLQDEVHELELKIVELEKQCSEYKVDVTALKVHRVIYGKEVDKKFERYDELVVVKDELISGLQNDLQAREAEVAKLAQEVRVLLAKEAKEERRKLMDQAKDELTANANNFLDATNTIRVRKNASKLTLRPATLKVSRPDSPDSPSLEFAAQKSDVCSKALFEKIEERPAENAQVEPNIAIQQYLPHLTSAEQNATTLTLTNLQEAEAQFAEMSASLQRDSLDVRERLDKQEQHCTWYQERCTATIEKIALVLKETHAITASPIYRMLAELQRLVAGGMASAKMCGAIVCEARVARCWTLVGTYVGFIRGEAEERLRQSIGVARDRPRRTWIKKVCVVGVVLVLAIFFMLEFWCLATSGDIKECRTVRTITVGPPPT